MPIPLSLSPDTVVQTEVAHSAKQGAEANSLQLSAELYLQARAQIETEKHNSLLNTQFHTVQKVEKQIGPDSTLKAEALGALQVQLDTLEGFINQYDELLWHPDLRDDKHPNAVNTVLARKLFFQQDKQLLMGSFNQIDSASADDLKDITKAAQKRLKLYNKIAYKRLHKGGMPLDDKKFEELLADSAFSSEQKYQMMLHELDTTIKTMKANGAGEKELELYKDLRTVWNYADVQMIEEILVNFINNDNNYLVEMNDKYAAFDSTKVGEMATILFNLREGDYSAFEHNPDLVTFLRDAILLRHEFVAGREDMMKVFTEIAKNE